MTETHFEEGYALTTEDLPTLQRLSRLAECMAPLVASDPASASHNAWLKSFCDKIIEGFDA